MYCTSCGSKIEEGNRYCTNCGSVVVGSNVNNNNYSDNSKGNVSLVFGILAFIFFWIPIFSAIFAIIGIVMGVKYKKETGDRAVGLIFSVIGLILSVIMVIGIVLFSTYFVSWVTNEDNVNYIIDEFTEEYGEYFDDNSNIFDISGNDWLGDDGSLLQLDKGGSYSWYQDSNASGNSYFLGDYVYYNGYEAMNYIADNLGEYSIIREEQRNFFKLGDYDIEDYYLIILNCEKMVIGGVEQQPTVSKMYYYGFFDDDSKRLELINMNSGNEAGFTLRNVKNSGGIDL